MLFQFAILLLVLLMVSIVMAGLAELIAFCIQYFFRRAEKLLLSEFKGNMILALLDARNEKLIVAWLQRVRVTTWVIDPQFRLYRLKRVSNDVQLQVGWILTNDRSELCTRRANQVCDLVFGTFERWSDEAHASIRKR